MPWGRLDDSLYDHPKLDEFPTDEPTLERIVESLPLEDLVRLAGVGLWARSISYSNRHLTDGSVSRSVVVRRLGGSPELADAVSHAGLFEHGSTGYQVHDFLEFNDSRIDVLERRDRETKRKAEYRRNKAAKTRPSGTEHGTSNGTGPDVPPVVPVGVPASSRARTGGIRESRPKPDPTRPDPTNESLKRGSARTRAATERADVAALHDRGWKRVTAKQRAVLDEVAARHDATGPGFAAEAIRQAPEGTDPLEAVMAADRLWQTSRRRQVDAEEAGWDETKRRERQETDDLVAARPPWLAEVTG